MILLFIETIVQAQNFNQPVTVNQQTIAKNTLESLNYQIEPASEHPFEMIIDLHLHNMTELEGPVSSKIKINLETELIIENYHYNEEVGVGVYKIDYNFPQHVQQWLFKELIENGDNVDIFFSVEPSLAKQLNSYYLTCIFNNTSVKMFGRDHTHQRFEIKAGKQSAMNKTMIFNIDTRQVLVSKKMGFFDFLKDNLFNSGAGSFHNFINLPSNPIIDKFEYTKFDLEGNMVFGVLKLYCPVITQISTIHFTTIGDLVSRLGGFYSAIVNLALVFISPFLFMSFMRTMTRQINSISSSKDSSLQEIEDQIKERIDYRNLFFMYDRVAHLEKAHQ